MTRTQSEIRADLDLVDSWAKASRNPASHYSQMQKKLIEVNRHQLLQELIAVQIETFDRG